MENRQTDSPSGSFLRRLRRRWNSWLTCTALSIVLIVYIAWQQGIFSGGGTQELLRAACDGCFVCALTFFALYIIALCVRNGAFSILRYGAATWSDSRAARHNSDAQKRYDNFADYLKKNSAGKRGSPAMLVFAGGFLALGLVFLFLYMK